MILKKIIFLIVFFCCNQLYSQRFALDTIAGPEVVVVADKKNCLKSFSKALSNSQLRLKNQRIQIKGIKIFKSSPENLIKIKGTGDIHKKFLSKKIELKNVVLKSSTGESPEIEVQKFKKIAQRLIEGSYIVWATVDNQVLLNKFYSCQTLPNYRWLFTTNQDSKDVVTRKENVSFRDEGSLRIYTEFSTHGRLMTIEMKALSLYEKDDKDFIFKYTYQTVKNGIELMKARAKLINREDHSTTRLTIDFESLKSSQE